MLKGLWVPKQSVNKEKHIMSNQKNNQTLDVNESLAKTEAFFIKYKSK